MKPRFLLVGLLVVGAVGAIWWLRQSPSASTLGPIATTTTTARNSGPPSLIASPADRHIPSTASASIAHPTLLSPNPSRIASPVIAAATGTGRRAAPGSHMVNPLDAIQDSSPLKMIPKSLEKRLPELSAVYTHGKENDFETSFVLANDPARKARMLAPVQATNPADLRAETQARTPDVSIRIASYTSAADTDIGLKMSLARPVPPKSKEAYRGVTLIWYYEGNVTFQAGLYVVDITASSADGLALMQKTIDAVLDELGVPGSPST